MELAYHATLVRDATAAFSHETMHAAHHPERCHVRPLCDKHVTADTVASSVGIVYDFR